MPVQAMSRSCIQSNGTEDASVTQPNPDQPSGQTLAQIVDQAIQALRAGKPQITRDLCTQLLRSKPDYAPALHLLAVLAMDAGDRVTAEALFRRAIAIEP